jgi:hypothetical protein
MHHKNIAVFRLFSTTSGLIHGYSQGFPKTMSSGEINQGWFRQKKAMRNYPEQWIIATTSANV